MLPAMQIKAADNRHGQVAELTALLARRDLPRSTRELIEREIRAITAGQRGEADAAYHIEFYARYNPDMMTLHDLRLQCNGRVAQIDHLIVTRSFEFWVCESKRFGDEVVINEHGEWGAHYGAKTIGIPSPIEQNRRHIAVLQDVFASRLVALVTEPDPIFRNLVLVSDRVLIRRPTGAAATRIAGLEGVIKVDQLKSKIDAATAGRRGAAHAARLVPRETIERVGRQLAALHSPARVKWASKFGLADHAHAESSAAGPRLAGARLGVVRLGAPALSEQGVGTPCERCGYLASPGVVEYCRDNIALFRGQLLCMFCQDDLYPNRY
jgi:hypothetical protein